MKLDTAITFAAISLVGFLLPCVYCAMDYDTLRLRKLIDKLTERELFPADDYSANDVASGRSDQALALRHFSGDIRDSFARAVPQPLNVPVSVYCDPTTGEPDPPPSRHAMCELLATTALFRIQHACKEVGAMIDSCHPGRPDDDHTAFFAWSPKSNTARQCRREETLEKCGVEKESRIHVMNFGVVPTALALYEAERRYEGFKTVYVPVQNWCSGKIHAAMCHVGAHDTLEGLAIYCPQVAQAVADFCLPRAETSYHTSHAPENLPPGPNNLQPAKKTMKECKVHALFTQIIIIMKRGLPAQS